MSAPMLDVTDKTDFGFNDDEVLPLTQCVCGTKFAPWAAILHLPSEEPWQCPNCQAKLTFRVTIRVFKITNNPNVPEQRSPA
jgi:hypothetical protein